jgi:SH3 domain-containing protein
MTLSSITLGLATTALAGVAACGARNADPAPVPIADSAKGPSRVVTETVTVRDKDLEQRVSRLELSLLERDAQVEDLQNRLEETRREVVRSMAKVQTLATRAEAASGMAEAEIALQTLRTSSRGPGSPDMARVSKLLSDATNEFNKQNYGGALYLANQAKSTAGVGRTRSAGGDASSLRPGEVPFAVPLELQASARCKVREGPGTTFRVLATLESGTSLTGLSHVDQWVRVKTDSGPSGWVFWNLVQRRADATSK